MAHKVGDRVQCLIALYSTESDDTRDIPRGTTGTLLSSDGVTFTFLTDAGQQAEHCGRSVFALVQTTHEQELLKAFGG